MESALYQISFVTIKFAAVSFFFFFFLQRDDVIRALDQAEGISFNARTKRLSYSSYTSHKPSECVVLPAGF